MATSEGKKRTGGKAAVFLAAVGAVFKRHCTVVTYPGKVANSAGTFPKISDGPSSGLLTS